MRQYAYSTIQFKAVDVDARVIEGIASTPTPDRIGDVMDPRGAKFSLPLPLLWQHKADKPIGQVLQATVTDAGIKIRAQIAKGVLPYIDEAWALIKAGLVPGLSIGWNPIDGERVKGGFKYTKWDWFELSAVTVPMNAETSITAIKSADAPHVPASGRTVASSSSPGVAGHHRKDKTMNVSEQLTARKAELKTKSARLEELMDRDDRTSEEDTELETLTTDVTAATKDVTRLTALENARAAQATVVVGTTSELATKSRENIQHVSVDEPKLPPGIALARVVKCRMASYFLAQKGVFRDAVDIARQYYPSHQSIITYLKAAVAPALTTDATWAGPLVYANTLESEFIEYLRPATILGKFGTGNIPSLRRVPFNSRIVGQTSGGTGYWVGQAKPKPLTKYDFDARSLTWAKVAAITVQSEELARFSSPNSEQVLRDALRDTLVAKLDLDVIDPDVAAVSNVNPASWTNGLSPLSPSGTDADAVRADIQALIAPFIAARISPAGIVLIMPSILALSLSLMRNGLGQKEFPGITMMGGELEGFPVIVSDYAAGPSAGAGNLVIAVSAPDIYLSDDGDVSIDISREASLEMSDGPTQDGSAGTGSTMVSMFQNNLVALRAERLINWAKRRTAAVAYMDDVAWGGADSPA